MNRIFARYTRRLREKFFADERGAIAIMIGIAVPVIFGFAMVAIDVGYLYRERNWLQISADAAVLAAAYDLNGTPVTTAIAYADKNMSGGVLTADHVWTGNWDTLTRTFTVNGTPMNAVKVTTRETTANGNPAPLFFARIFGYNTQDVVATAIAIAGGNTADCFDAGARAGGTFNMDVNVGLSRVCVYGQEGVTFGDDASVNSAAAVGTPDCNDYAGGDCAGFTTGAAPDITGNIIGMDLGLSQTGVESCITNFIAMLKSGYPTVFGCGDVWPSYITDVVYDTTSTALPANPAPGTAYIFQQDITVDASHVLDDNFIISEGSITVSQYGDISNTTYSCWFPNDTTVGIMAVDDIVIETGSQLAGTTLWSGNDINVDAGIRNFQVSLTSGGDMNFVEDPDLEGCNLNLGGALGTGTGGLFVRLVK
jgi:hypothetical protein